MFSHWRRWLLLGATAGLLGATPARSLDRVQQGNAAFAQQDFARALELYTEAEEQTLDPGSVSFNKATALYRLALTTDQAGKKSQLLREAAAHYGRCQNDPGRRGRALYGRANCLLLGQAGEEAALREAAQCYRACLQDDDARALHDNARHNLELAKLLWVKASAQAGKDKPEKPPEENPKESPMTTQDPKPQPMNTGEKDAGSRGKTNDKGTKTPVKPETGGMEPVPVDELPPPGTGNLPPIPDKDEVVPLAPEDAARHLEQAARRIQQERRAHRIRTAPKLPDTVKDW